MSERDQIQTVLSRHPYRDAVTMPCSTRPSVLHRIAHFFGLNAVQIAADDVDDGVHFDLFLVCTACGARRHFVRKRYDRTWSSTSTHIVRGYQ